LVLVSFPLPYCTASFEGEANREKEKSVNGRKKRRRLPRAGPAFPSFFHLIIATTREEGGKKGKTEA